MSEITLTSKLLICTVQMLCLEKTLMLFSKQLHSMLVRIQESRDRFVLDLCVMFDSMPMVTATRYL